MELSDAVLPPAARLWVGEVGEGGWARPNLSTQYGCVHDAQTSLREQTCLETKTSLTFPIRMCPVAFFMKTSRLSPSSKGK